MGKWAAGKESGQKCFATYPATLIAGLLTVIPSIRREIPVVNRFKPNIARWPPSNSTAGELKSARLASA